MEVVLLENSGEVVFRFALLGRGHRLELRKSQRVVHALLEHVELGLAHTHLTIHLEHALSGVIERIKAYRFKLEVLRVAAKQVQSFGF